MHKQPEMSDSTSTPPEPDFAEKFDVKLFGVPLSWRDNIVGLLPVLLAIFLQIRLNDTFFAEGIFALLGVVGFIAQRLWLAGRRFSDPGQVELHADRIVVPASIAGGQTASIAFEDITRLQLFIYRGRFKLTPTSLIIWRGFFFVKISFLAVDLEPLVRAIEEKKCCRISREPYSPVAVMALLLLTCLLFIAYIIWKQAG